MVTDDSMDGFEVRPTRMIAVEKHAGWDFKLYVITLPDSSPNPAALDASRQVLDRLPRADVTPAVGFAIVHQGREALWLLVARWRKDILYHRTHRSDLTENPTFQPVDVDGPTACLWELAVHAHERDSYIENVFAKRPPNPGWYLADALTI